MYYSNNSQEEMGEGHTGACLLPLLLLVNLWFKNHCLVKMGPGYSNCITTLIAGTPHTHTLPRWLSGKELAYRQKMQETLIGSLGGEDP